MSLALTDAEAAEARGLIERLGVLLREREAAVAPPASSSPLTLLPADYTDAAEALSCDVAAIHAVDAVESNGHGFAADGRPIILYEPHVFSRLTAHRFDAGYGGVSYPKWGSKPYPTDQKARWDQLLYAAKLDHDAAYKSASFGRFQIMGFNHAACGFASVDTFVAAMATGERAHLMAFVQFVLSSHLDDELRGHEWAAFAERYNGPGQVPAYSAKLAAAYARASETV